MIMEVEASRDELGEDLEKVYLFARMSFLPPCRCRIFTTLPPLQALLDFDGTGERGNGATSLTPSPSIAYHSRLGAFYCLVDGSGGDIRINARNGGGICALSPTLGKRPRPAQAHCNHLHAAFVCAPAAAARVCSISPAIPDQLIGYSEPRRSI